MSLRDERPVCRKMAFHSILFIESDPALPTEPPPFFVDLNLGKIVDSITGGWKDFNLAPFYYLPLSDLDAIAYRQEVMREITDRGLMKTLSDFTHQMRTMRQYLGEAKKIEFYKYSKERRFLSAAEVYCQAVQCLQDGLRTADLKSRGLRGFTAYLTEYVNSFPFHILRSESEKLISDLSSVRYGLLLDSGRVTVRPFSGEIDYSVAVEETFEKFRCEATGKYLLESVRWDGMNHIEAQIQDRVALMYPEIFGALDKFASTHADFIDETVSRFDREIQFYIAYLTFLEKFQRVGLSFCQPQVSGTSKEVSVREAFDLALADKLVGEGSVVVSNDFFLAGRERIFVVSGPNQGGKTTFARMFGQMHYLASLGCHVPGKEARLFLFDRLFTHFEKEEDITNLRGKLQDDLVRIHQILESATSGSLLIMNEMFSSTTLQDAAYLSRKIMSRISSLDVLGVWVTFLDELASFNEKTVSVVSRVDPANPAVRTFRVERRPADGLAYALAIAQKHRVTYDLIKERINA